jgi:hypothetical protein
MGEPAIQSTATAFLVCFTLDDSPRMGVIGQSISVNTDTALVLLWLQLFFTAFFYSFSWFAA